MRRANTAIGPVAIPEDSELTFDKLRTAYAEMKRNGVDPGVVAMTVKSLESLERSTLAPFRALLASWEEAYQAEAKYGSARTIIARMAVELEKVLQSGESEVV